MNPIKITISFLIMLILLLASCSNNNELNIANEDTRDNVLQKECSGEEKAIMAFNNFMKSFNNAQTSTRSNKIQSISKIHKTNTNAYSKRATTRSNSEGTPIYELTLQNTDSSEGFAIVADVQQNYEVLAFVPMGGIVDTTFNQGLAIWFDDLSLSLNNNTTRTDIWQDGWNYESGEIGPSEFYRYITREELDEGWAHCFYYGPIDNEIMYNRDEVSVSWSQTSPYNNNVTYYFNNNGITEKCRVGCFAVALGQLMSYHKYPASYNWNLLTANSEIKCNTAAATEVAKLLSDIARIGKTDYDTNTGAGSTAISENIPTLHSFGYDATVIDIGNMKTSQIIEEQMKKTREPVLYDAQSSRGGHIWIIDGLYRFERWYYYPSRVMPSKSPTGYELHRTRTMRRLLHCNWGWGGLSNGWYYNFTPQYTDSTYVKFNSYRHLYLGITPKK